MAFPPDSPDLIRLDPGVVAAKQVARYQRLVADLLGEIAQLETYVAQLLEPPGVPSAGGNLPERNTE